MTDKIVVLIHYKGEFVLDAVEVQQWREQFPQANIVECHGDAIAPNLLSQAEVFIGNPTNDLLKQMPKLKWVQLHSAGANQYMNNPHLRDDVVLTNCSGVFGVPGAEQAMALMYAFTREIHTHVRQTARKIWRKNDHALEVTGATVAVLGLGDIGSETAKRAKGALAHVIAVKRHATDKPDYVDELYTTAQLHEILAKSDFVINTLPLTAETKGLISRNAIAAMKPGAVFINVGRGDTVDEAALIEALQDGKLTGAGLDVTAVEPLPQDSLLWELPNVIITSHSVNASPSKQSRRIKIMKNNLARYFQDQPLTNVVDRELGY